MAINMTFVDFVTPVPADWLNNVNTFVNNPAVFNYTAPFAGAIARSLNSKLSDTVSIADFGGSPAASAATNTTALLAATATGRRVYIPGGNWNLNPLSMVSGGIVGDGQFQTILSFADVSTSDLITITGTGGNTPAVFKDFTVIGNFSKTTGATLRFNAPSGQLAYANVTNVGFFNIPTGIYFSNDSQFVVDQCNFVNYSAQGMHIENTNISDSGDSAISNCFFNTAVPTGSTQAIWHRSGGGLKLVNVKILGGNNGYVMGWIGTTNGAADLSITGCSIEDVTGVGIFLGRDSGTANLGSVMIGDNEIGCPTCIQTDTSGFLTLVSIADNVLNIEGTTTASNGIGLNGVSNFSIGQNVINAQNGGTPIGIAITASCSNGKIAPQVWVNLPAANCLSNASSTVYAQGTKQNGAASVTASSAYGALFQGSTAVTFPNAYKVAPTVICYPTGTSGGQVSCFAANVTTAGFTMVGISATSGGAMTNNVWISEGLI